ncbi:MAG: sigma-70 family RNA polymerase sigma factor [Betaproteobacteria bacterium]
MSAPETSGTLLEKLRDCSNSRAWRLFADLYSPSIFAIARRKGLNDADARDVVQESLLRCCRALPGFEYDATKKFRGWLSQVVTNVIMDRYRNDKGRPIATGQSSMLERLDQQPGREPDPAADMLAVDAAQTLQGMVDAVCSHLNANQRDAFLMMWVEGLSDEQIAERTGKRQGAIRAVRFRIRKRLEAYRDEFTNSQDE